MLNKSEERKKLEETINLAHDTSRNEAISWCKKHPIKGIKAIYSMMKCGEVANDVAQIWANLPSWKLYKESYDKLEALESKEGFPAMKQYASELDIIKSYIPTNVTNAYYPFSGLDFYPARIFQNITFEDKCYFSEEYIKNMWWDKVKYSEKNIKHILKTLESAKIIDTKNNIQFRVNNSETPLENEKYNTSNHALIVKGGHSTQNFIEKRFGDKELSFGAIILGTPADNINELKEYLTTKKYSCVYDEKKESYYAPYSMGFGRQLVFVKNK